MTQPNASGQENIEAKLPRRDWILLPLLSLLTIGLLAASTESDCAPDIYRVANEGG